MLFQNYLKAGYPLLWVETHEEDRAINTLSNQVPDYNIHSWDIINGMKDHSSNMYNEMNDPIQPLQSISSLSENSILFLKDFHKFISSVEIFRTIKNLVPVLKATNRHIVFISPLTNIPVELEKEITIFPFDLPSASELLSLANTIITENNLEIDIDKTAITTGKGLTLAEAENALALSLVSEKKFSKKIIEAEKLQAVKKSGLMELYTAIPENQLGGLDNLKKYIHNRKKGFIDNDLPTPKGILLVGLPGGGKSLSAKITASILDMPLIKLDISGLKGSLVGESEKKMKSALNIIDAISPCVVWLDEIEKSLGGVQSSNKTDGGTTSAMFGQLLTWMQESETAKYIVATCNDINDLLSISQGALLRRFDDVFFVDLPSNNERKSILAIMNNRYKSDVSDKLTDKMENWTGAEIEKFVKASIYDGIDESLNNIKPIFNQNRELIEKARNWAKFNARYANSNNNVTSQKQGRNIKL